MEIEATEVIKVNAKTLKLHLKVCDQFTASLENGAGTELHSQDDGYVPAFMPEQHYGDYVILDIDIDSGQITNWQKPTADQIQNWISGED